MNILVCIKQVACICAPQGIDPSTGAINPAALVHMVNPCDEVAIEEALRIREKAGGGTVTLITLGPSLAQDALLWGLAMGADQGIHLPAEDAEVPDAWATALFLSRVIEKMACDLIIFGRRTIEHGSGHVGTFVAHLLDLPLVTSVVKLDFSHDGQHATVERGVEKGNRERVECPLPAVFTVEKGLNKPRYPTWPDRKAARNKTVQRVDLAFTSERDWPEMEIVKVAPPRLRPKKILAPDSNLSPSAKLKFIMAGGMAEKKGSAMGGDATQLAAGIIDFLKEQGLI